MTLDEQTNALVLEHLADIEGAVRYIEDHLEPRLWRAVAETMERWSARTGWAGRFDPDGDDYWIAADGWMPEGERQAWFVFKAAEHVDAVSLSAFVGASASGNQMVLRFWQDLLKPGAFKKILSGEDRLLSDLRYLGFEFDARGGLLELPVRLDATALAAAFTDGDFTEALAPLATALDRAEAARPSLDLLVARLRAAA